MLSFYDFLDGPTSFAKVTLPSDEEMGRFFDIVLDDEAEWIIDYDPLWREIILYQGPGEQQACDRLESLIEQISSEAGLTQRGAFAVEVPGCKAEGRARRAYVRNNKTHSAEVSVCVKPGEPGSGIIMSCLDNPYAPVLAHGARRAARLGPRAAFPMTDLRIHVEHASVGEQGPALADLHAAATYASSRAFQAAETKLCDVSKSRTEIKEIARFPDMENSAAETFLNLVELFAYPVDLLSEEERTQLGAFVAYLVSMIFGHDVDIRMRRQPREPSRALKHLLGHIADDLAKRAVADGRPGAQMVMELLEIWVNAWKSPLRRDEGRRDEEPAAEPADDRPRADDEAQP